MMQRLSLFCVLLLLASAAAAGSAVADQVEVEAEAEYVIADADATALLETEVWRHEPVDHSLLQHEHTVEMTATDGPRGLETEGATTAHYATLAHDNTWDVSRRYCADHGAELCTRHQICDDGRVIGADEIKRGVTAFAPIAGSGDWIQLTGRKKCRVVRNAKWGKKAKTMKEQNRKWARWPKSYVPCCNKNGVMKSYLMPDNSLVDPAMEAKLQNAHKTASRALDALKKIKREMKKMKHKFIVMSKGAASKKTVAQLKQALKMRGNSKLVRTVRHNARVAKAALNHSKKHGMCCGMTRPRHTRWKQYSRSGIYLDVSIAKCHFHRTPIIVSSVGGTSNHWTSKGAATHYSLRPTSFRVYIYKPNVTPTYANRRSWNLRWCAQEP